MTTFKFNLDFIELKKKNNVAYAVVTYRNIGCVKSWFKAYTGKKEKKCLNSYDPLILTIQETGYITVESKSSFV